LILSFEFGNKGRAAVRFRKTCHYFHECSRGTEAALFSQSPVAVKTLDSIVFTCRFQSSYPTRNDTPAAWYVDGASFMEAVADAMEDAREQIFLTDWYISPELYLKRRPKVYKREERFDPDYWRLDMTLKRAAVSVASATTLPLTLEVANKVMLIK
jgi:hypothetical protein